jgi:hypothetical protein
VAGTRPTKETGTTKATGTSGPRRTLVWIRRLVPMGVGAGLLYLAWLIVTANGEPVKVDFLIGRIEIAVWQALGAAFVLGAALAGLYALYQMARGGLVSRRYRKQLANLESEVHQLRNLPLAPEEAPADERSRALDIDPEPGGAFGSSA